MPGKKTGTTRRGTSFKNTGADTDEREVMTTGVLAEILKTLLTDRKTLEELTETQRWQDKWTYYVDLWKEHMARAAVIEGRLRIQSWPS